MILCPLLFCICKIFHTKAKWMDACPWLSTEGLWGAPCRCVYEHPGDAPGLSVKMERWPSSLSLLQDFPGGPEPKCGAAHDGEAGLQEQRRDQHCAIQPCLPHPRHLLPLEQETWALPVRGEWGPRGWFLWSLWRNELSMLSVAQLPTLDLSCQFKLKWDRVSWMWEKIVAKAASQVANACHLRCFSDTLPRHYPWSARWQSPPFFFP